MSLDHDPINATPRGIPDLATVELTHATSSSGRTTTFRPQVHTKEPEQTALTFLYEFFNV